MKRYVVVVLLALLTERAFAQGSIQFNNRVTGTSTAAVVAPVYDANPIDPYERVPGAGGFRGPLLVGSGFTASLWARPAGSAGPFVLASQSGTTPFRTTTSSALFGFWTVPSTAAVLSNVPSDPAIRAEIIIRVWDNQGGTITSWDQLYDPVTGNPNLANRLVHRGESLMFTTVDQLGGGTVLPPTLHGLQSFELYIEQVPEPSVIVFGLLAAGGLVLARKRKVH